MKEKAGVLMVGACAAAFLALGAYAQEEAAPAQAATAPAEEQAVKYEPLIRAAEVKGVCEVFNPDVGSWTAVLERKAYPMGSKFRTGADGTFSLIFSREDSLTLAPSSEVLATASRKNPDVRIVRLLNGSAKTNLRDNAPDGSFNLLTDNALCKSLTGKGEYKVSYQGATETFVANTITGSCEVEGPQYKIPALRAANTVSIETTEGRALSRLSSVSGDFGITLDSGQEEPVKHTMTPKAVVKIWRERAPVGGRTVVSVLAVNHLGRQEHRFAYVVGRPTLATGELVKKEEEAPAEEDLPVLVAPDKEKAAAAEPAAEPAADAGDL